VAAHEMMPAGSGELALQAGEVIPIHLEPKYPAPVTVQGGRP
jgi:hypothetical protein